MLKNIVAVLKGTVVAQLISLVLMPIVTREFGPESFGQYQLYLSCLVPLLVLITMRYEIAILQADDGPELTALIHLCIAIVATTSALVAVLGEVGRRLTHWPANAPTGFMALLAIGCFFGGLLQVFSYLAVRSHAFRIGAVAKVVQSGVTGAASVLAGWLWPFPGTLILADIVGRWCGSLAFLPNGRGALQGMMARPSVADIRRVAVKYRALPTISVLGGLINSAGGVITPLAMYSYFNAQVAGQFGIVERFIVGPLGILGVAISQAFMADLASVIRRRAPGSLAMFWSVVRKTMFIGVLLAVPCAIFSPTAVEFVFGSDWAVAGLFAQLLTPLFLITLTASAVSMTLAVSGHQRLQLVWELARLMVMASVWYVIVHAKWSKEWAVIAHGAALTLMYAVYVAMAHFALRRSDQVVSAS